MKITNEAALLGFMAEHLRMTELLLKNQILIAGGSGIHVDQELLDMQKNIPAQLRRLQELADPSKN